MQITKRNNNIPSKKLGARALKKHITEACAFRLGGI